MQKIKADNKYREKELINGLEISDGINPNKKLLLGADSNHVEMATGRTLEEDYTALLKQHGKEFTSTGIAITVNNGIKGKVLSGKIEGNTVKNYIDSKSTALTITGRAVATPLLSTKTIDTSKQYKLIFFASSVTGTCEVQLTKANGTGDVNSSISAKLGINEKTFTPLNADVGQVGLSSGSSEDCSIKIEWIALTDIDAKVSRYIPLGLSSTQAVLNNNGQSYPIYEPLIYGKTRILDADTGLVPTDPTLPALKDGDVLDLATKTIKFANKSTQVLTDEQVKAYSKYKKVISLGRTSTKKDTLEIKDDGSAIYTQNTKDADDGSSRIDLPAPIMTHIDKSLLPTIITQQTNTIEVGGAVKPSSFKVTVPTTDGVKKEYVLTPINGWAGTSKANLLQTGDIGLVLDLTIPEQFNTIICSLPTELRPKAERTVLGYNGNTPVVIKVLPTGEVKCMTQQSGKIELNDTYEI